MKEILKRFYRVIYLALACVLIICTFNAGAAPENDTKAEFMAMLESKGITYEYALNQTSAIIMYNELLDVLSEDCYGGMYVGDDGNLVINASDLSEVNNAVALVKSKLSKQAEKYADFSQSDIRKYYEENDSIFDETGEIDAPDMLINAASCTVNISECNYSLTELNEISDIIEGKMSEFNIKTLAIDEEHNKITVGVQSDTSSVEKTLKSELSAASVSGIMALHTAKTSDTPDYTNCIEVKESANEIVPRSDVWKQIGSAIYNRQTLRSFSLGPGIMWTDANGSHRYGWLTAGHCGEIGDVIKTDKIGTCSSGTLGTITLNYFDNGLDVAFIEQEPGTNIKINSLLYYKNETLNRRNSSCTGTMEAPKGTTVYHYSYRLNQNGSYSDGIPIHTETCISGQVSDATIKVNYNGKSFTTSEANFMSGEGCSGGPVTIKLYTTVYKFYNLTTGILSFSEKTFLTPSYFTKIKDIENKFGGSMFIIYTQVPSGIFTPNVG